MCSERSIRELWSLPERSKTTYNKHDSKKNPCHVAVNVAHVAIFGIVVVTQPHTVVITDIGQHNSYGIIMSFCGIYVAFIIFKTIYFWWAKHTHPQTHSYSFTCYTYSPYICILYSVWKTFFAISTAREISGVCTYENTHTHIPSDHTRYIPKLFGSVSLPLRRSLSLSLSPIELKLIIF